MFIVILDHENMGVDTIFLTLPLITKKLLKKIQGGPEKTKPKLFKVIYPQT